MTLRRLHIAALILLAGIVLLPAGCSRVETQLPVDEADAGLGGYLTLSVDSPVLERPATKAGGFWDNADGPRTQWTDTPDSLASTEENTLVESRIASMSVVLFEKNTTDINASPMRYVYHFGIGNVDGGYKDTYGSLTSDGSFNYRSSTKAVRPGDFVAVVIGNTDPVTRAQLNTLAGNAQMPLDIAYTYGDFKTFYVNNFLSVKDYYGITDAVGYDTGVLNETPVGDGINDLRLMPSATVDENFTMPAGFGKYHPFVKSLSLMKPVAKLRVNLTNTNIWLDSSVKWVNGKLEGPSVMYPDSDPERFFLDPKEGVQILNYIPDGPVLQWVDTHTTNTRSFQTYNLTKDWISPGASLPDPDAEEIGYYREDLSAWQADLSADPAVIYDYRSYFDYYYSNQVQSSMNIAGFTGTDGVSFPVFLSKVLTGLFAEIVKANAGSLPPPAEMELLRDVLLRQLNDDDKFRNFYAWYVEKTSMSMADFVDHLLNDTWEGLMTESLKAEYLSTFKNAATQASYPSSLLTALSIQRSSEDFDREWNTYSDGVHNRPTTKAISGSEEHIYFGELFTTYLWQWSHAYPRQQRDMSFANPPASNHTCLKLTFVDRESMDMRTNKYTQKWEYVIPIYNLDDAPLIAENVNDYRYLEEPGRSGKDAFKSTIMRNYIYQLDITFQGVYSPLKWSVTVLPWNKNVQEYETDF